MADRLTYETADLERTRLRRNSYDVVVAWMALHHLRGLRHVFREVRQSLKPGGIFIVNEYVGPARFQVPDRQAELINSLLAEVPEELRRKPDGELKERFARPPLWEIIGHDASEAVSSHRIMSALGRQFAVAERVEYGGTILNWLLEGIVQNFQPDSPEHRAVLDRLYAAEREVIESREFASDFAFVIAQRPEDSGPE